jgi:hypothetical protein
MTESKDKTPEQVSDEDYKVAPTSADEKLIRRKSGSMAKDNSAKRNNLVTKEPGIQEELKEGTV